MNYQHVISYGLIIFKTLAGTLTVLYRNTHWFSKAHILSVKLIFATAVFVLYPSTNPMPIQLILVYSSPLKTCEYNSLYLCWPSVHHPKGVFMLSFIFFRILLQLKETSLIYLYWRSYMWCRFFSLFPWPLVQFYISGLYPLF